MSPTIQPDQRRSRNIPLILMFSQKDRVVSLKRNRAIELTLYRGYGPLMPLAHPRRGLSSTAKTSVVTLILMFYVKTGIKKSV